MKTTSLTRRWATALITSALVAGTAVGCAAGPSPSGPAASASSAGHITPDEAPQREDLIRAVQEAAILISGDQVQPFRDFAQACTTGDGVMFAYDVAVPDNGDAQANYERIASQWNELGIATNLSSSGVSTSTGQLESRSGPVYYIAVAHNEAIGDSPAQYHVGGFTHCVPGLLADYEHLTSQ